MYNLELSEVQFALEKKQYHPKGLKFHSKYLLQEGSYNNIIVILNNRLAFVQFMKFIFTRNLEVPCNVEVILLWEAKFSVYNNTK